MSFKNFFPLIFGFLVLGLPNQGFTAFFSYLPEEFDSRGIKVLQLLEGQEGEQIEKAIEIMINLSIEVETKYGKNSLETADAYVNLAFTEAYKVLKTQMLSQKIDFEEIRRVEKIYLQGIRIFKEKRDFRSAAVYLTWLGSLSVPAADVDESPQLSELYENGELYLKEALSLLEKMEIEPLPSEKLSVKSFIAENLENQKKFKEALLLRKEIIKLDQPVSSKAEALVALGDNLFDQGIDGTEYLEKAFDLIKDLENLEKERHQLAGDLSQAYDEVQKADKAILYHKYKYGLSKSFLGEEAATTLMDLIDLGVSSCMFRQRETCSSVLIQLNLLFIDLEEGSISPRFISWEKKETVSSNLYENLDQFLSEFYRRGAQVFAFNPTEAALETFKKWIEKSDEFIDIDEMDALELSIKARLKLIEGDVVEARKLWLKTLSLINQEDSATKIILKWGYADFLRSTGNPEASLRFLEENPPSGLPPVYNYVYFGSILNASLAVGDKEAIFYHAKTVLNYFLETESKSVKSPSKQTLSDPLLATIVNDVISNDRLKKKDRDTLFALYFKVSQLKQYSRLEEEIIKANAKGKISFDPSLLALVSEYEFKEKIYSKKINKYLTEPSWGGVFVDQTTQEEILALEDEISILRSELELRAPLYLTDTEINISSIHEVQKALNWNEAVILDLPDSYSGSSLLVVLTNRNYYYSLFGEEREKEFTKFFEGYSDLTLVIEKEDLREERMSPFAYSIMYEAIFNNLFKLKDLRINHLYMVNLDLQLQGLPFSALITGPTRELDYSLFETKDYPYLIDKYSISFFNSLAPLMSLKQNKTTQRGHYLVGFGDPLLEGDSSVIASVKDLFRGNKLANTDDIRQMPRLPDTANELIDLAALFEGNSEIFLREQATEKNIKERDLSNATILVFATHGIRVGEIEGLDQPGLIFSPPKSKSEKDDGVLTANEISKLKINADLVILSACDTASPGAEENAAFTGLAQAFFAAGAKNVMATGWRVNSEAASIMTPNIIKEKLDNPQISYAEALRISMLKMARNKNKPYLRHPYYWSSYSLMGVN